MCIILSVQLSEDDLKEMERLFDVVSSPSHPIPRRGRTHRNIPTDPNCSILTIAFAECGRPPSQIDTDKNGMLSAEELKGLLNGIKHKSLSANRDRARLLHSPLEL